MILWNINFHDLFLRTPRASGGDPFVNGGDIVQIISTPRASGGDPNRVAVADTLLMYSPRKRG